MSKPIVAIIPARFASTRFPGKPLVEIHGKTMIRRVVEQVQKSELVDKVIVATDDESIYSHVRSFCEVRMTPAELASGTDRCAEVLKEMHGYHRESIILNVQGDEPFIQPRQIDLLLQFMLDNPLFEIATMVKMIDNSATLFDSNIVKVVFSTMGKALYFSRHAIPFVRGVDQRDWIANANFFKHIGMYAFRSEALLAVATLPVSALEKVESLEQLRWLENGYTIGVVETEMETVGIDTPDDLAKITI